MFQKETGSFGKVVIKSEYTWFCALKQFLQDSEFVLENELKAVFSQYLTELSH